MKIRIACVDCLKPYGPITNLDSIHFMWTTCACYFRNHATVVIPSRTAGNKLLYVRHYRAEIGVDESRACRTRMWGLCELLAYYKFVLPIINLGVKTL